MGTHSGAVHGDSTLRLVALLGTIAGAFLITDIAIITITNSHIEPLDSILFFIGLAAMVLTIAALVVHLSEGRAGLSRVGYAVLAFVGIVLIMGAISAVADRIGRTVFSPANIGLHGEWSFFVTAIMVLIIAGWAARSAAARGGSD